MTNNQLSISSNSSFWPFFLNENQSSLSETIITSPLHTFESLGKSLGVWSLKIYCRLLRILAGFKFLHFLDSVYVKVWNCYFNCCFVDFMSQTREIIQKNIEGSLWVQNYYFNRSILHLLIILENLKKGIG